MRFEVFLIRKVTAANVARLARRKEPENWAFREWLKESGIDAAEIDVIVHELYRQESAAFDCTACASCCKGISPLLDAEDISTSGCRAGYARRSSDLQTTSSGMTSTAAGRSTGRRARSWKITGARATSTARTTAPLTRTCRRTDFVGRLSNTVANCSVCPIVYMVYERLKAEIETQRAPRTR